MGQANQAFPGPAICFPPLLLRPIQVFITMEGRDISEANPVAIVGAGWLGRALARHFDVTAIPRRAFHADRVAPGSSVYVASGRSAISSDEDFSAALRAELAHLRSVLVACERAGARRVVVLGSSDVAGLDERVVGTSPLHPLTPYARVKAALEDECGLQHERGAPLTVVRLAPVHGPGKRRTATLLRLARQPVVPLPGNGRHSIGFVLLDDAVRALAELADRPSPCVVSVGAGHTPLRDLLDCLARAQAHHPRWAPIPLPRWALRRAATMTLPDHLHWIVRISLPRQVAMEVPVEVTPLPAAGRILVRTC